MTEHGTSRPRTLLALTLIVLAFTASGLAWVANAPPLEVRAGIGFVTVTGATPGDRIRIELPDHTVRDVAVDTDGATLIPGLPAGPITVEQRRSDRLILQRHVRVPASTDPRTLAHQDLLPGLNYLRMPDGTTLSAWVTLPGPVEEGPYPTVVELSAYRIGDPGDGTGEELSPETAGTQPATASSRAFGYATVGVNIRGSGCSGGALDLFGDAQLADGHDVIEMVAAQPWVAGGEVGLVGFSLGGLIALHTASSRPPSLAAVAALSVYAESWQAFHPGGLVNEGFPVGWFNDLLESAGPLGTPWVAERIAEGDLECERNQRFREHLSNPTGDLLGDVPFTDEFTRMSPVTWAPEIEVPVLLSGQFQDATLGADIAPHLEAFSSSPLRRLVLTNGSHGDGIAPQIISRFGEFLDLLVAERVPTPLDDVLRRLLGDDAGSMMPLPIGPPTTTDDSEQPPTSHASALEHYRQLDPIEILWASGAGDPPGSAAAVTSSRVATWPPPGTSPLSWFLTPGGVLAPRSLPAGPHASIRTDSGRAALPWSTDGSDLLHNVFVDQADPLEGTAARWTSEPLEDDLVLAGTASVDLQIRTSVPDVDLQAVLFEVDDQGRETLLQNGWVRAGYRRPTDQTTPLRPAIDFHPDAHEDLPPNVWTGVRIEIPSFAHVVHRGNRLRLQIGTPGDRQVQWQFGGQPAGDADIEIKQGGDAPSRLVLPVAPLGPRFDEPDCGSLRSQPCRAGATHHNVETSGS